MPDLSPFDSFDLVSCHASHNLISMFPWLMDYTSARFSALSAEALRELILAPINHWGDDVLWKGRSVLMVDALVPALIQLRHDADVAINYPLLERSLSYAGFLDLYEDDRLSFATRKIMLQYLHQLPGPVSSTQQFEMHSYNSMSILRFVSTMKSHGKAIVLEQCRGQMFTIEGLRSVLLDLEQSDVIPKALFQQWLIESGIDKLDILKASGALGRRAYLETELQL